jgi:hypothetical protein
MLIALAGLTAGLLQTGTALAQQEDPIAPFVIDVRGAFMTYAPDDALAVSLGLDGKAQMPARGMGLELGAHVYPLRGKSVALGLGATALFTRGKKAPQQPDDPTAAPSTDPTIETKVKAFTPQVSLNFGSRRGYSYVSGGIGTVGRTITATEGSLIAPVPDETRVRALSYGGGARWFSAQHFAFTFDLRWYRVQAQDATVTSSALPAQRLFVASAGISIH